MNKYLAYYRGKRIEIEAITAYAAQVAAAELLNVTDKNRYLIGIMLISFGGKEIINDTSMF